MTPKKIKTKQEEKAAARDYLKKAGDNHDAICVFEKGIRSISQDHFDVCDIVKSITLPDAEEKANLLRRIISKKNLIQYERRNIYQSEADEIAKASSRFYQWVASHVK